MNCWRKIIKWLIAKRIEAIIYKNSKLKNHERTALYKKIIKMGNHCVIKSGCIITEPENIVMGDGVSVQHNCYLSGYGGLKIGNDVSIGAGTKIFTSKYPCSGYKEKEKAIKYVPLEESPVVIGNNVIMGANSIILGGVAIGDNVMIGAGSVVTKDIPSNSVYAGDPAKFIRRIEI